MGRWFESSGGRFRFLEIMENEKKKELWILFVIGRASEKRFAISLSELLSVGNQGDIPSDKTLEILSQLTKKGFIKFEDYHYQASYRIIDKGEEYLTKSLRKLTSQEHLLFLNTLPSEVMQGYRIFNIENTIFYGAIGWMFFQFSIWLIRSSQIISAFLLLLVSFLCIGASIAYFSKIITMVLFRIFILLEKQIKTPKILGFFSKISKIMMRVLAHLGLFSVTFVASILKSIKYIWGRIIKNLTKIIFLILAVTGAYFATPILLAPENLNQTIYQIAWAVEAFAIIVVGLVIFKKNPEEKLNELINPTLSDNSNKA